MEDEILNTILDELRAIRFSVDYLTHLLKGEIPSPPNDDDVPQLIEADNLVTSSSFEGDVF